jgi:pSer/pThr/pTyr-binding forkhead associated (FHA) protein
MPRLILMFKDTTLNTYPLVEGVGLTIGRHRSNDLIIDNLAVSGYHARIDLRPEGLVIKDLESKNGTFVNDQRIANAILNNKDSVTIGKHSLLVDLTDDVDVEPSVSDAGSPAKASNVLSNDKTMFLDTPHGRQMRGEEQPPPEPAYPETDMIIFLAGGPGEFDISKLTSITIGRNKDADIVISGFWGLMVGGPAAIINKRTGSYFLRYTGGLIKPKRNGSAVKGTVKLNHEDVVELGPVKIQIQLSGRTVIQQ